MWELSTGIPSHLEMAETYAELAEANHLVAELNSPVPSLLDAPEGGGAPTAIATSMESGSFGWRRKHSARWGPVTLPCGHLALQDLHLRDVAGLRKCSSLAGRHRTSGCIVRMRACPKRDMGWAHLEG